MILAKNMPLSHFVLFYKFPKFCIHKVNHTFRSKVCLPKQTENNYQLLVLFFISIIMPALMRKQSSGGVLKRPAQ